MRRAAARGFSLMELMVVVLLVAILAMLAIPSMTTQRYDRLAFSDASNITELLRTARTRAVGRGSAVLVRMSADTTGSATPTQRGRFEVWEAVSPNVSFDGGAAGWNRTPRSSCKTPTMWTLDATIPPPSGANAAFIDAVDLNGDIDARAGIQAQIFDPTATSTGSATSDMYLCFTPLGRVYQSAGGTTPNFDASAPVTGVTRIRVYRYDANGFPSAAPSSVKFVGTLRTITLAGAGMARMVSQ